MYSVILYTCFLYKYMYIHVYIYVYKYIYIYIYIYIHTQTRTHTYIYIYMFVCIVQYNVTYSTISCWLTVNISFLLSFSSEQLTER